MARKNLIELIFQGIVFADVKRYQQLTGASQVALMVKNPPANAGDIRDAGLIPRFNSFFPGGRHDNPLQYSCLENPMDREPGRLQSIGLQSVGRDFTQLSTYIHSS